MNINDKINSLTSANTVRELDRLLNQAHVSISWSGKRVVSVKGFEGTVLINTLALKFLKADAFNTKLAPPFQTRLECYALWDRIQWLYDESDRELSKSCFYKHYVPLREFRPYCRACSGDPMAIIGGWEFGAMRDQLVEFSPEEFKTLWPNTKANGKSEIFYRNGERIE